MSKMLIYKKFLPLFIVGIIGFATLGGWISVQAQQQTQPGSSTPQFTPFQNAGKSGLLRDGKPFKPANLNQSDKPDGNNRGLVYGVDRRRPMLSKDYPKVGDRSGARYNS